MQKRRRRPTGPHDPKRIYEERTATPPKEAPRAVCRGCQLPIDGPTDSEMHPRCRRLEQERNERPATKSQLAALRRHGIAIPEGLTVARASALLAPDVNRELELAGLRRRARSRRRKRPVQRRRN